MKNMVEKGRKREYTKRVSTHIQKFIIKKQMEADNERDINSISEIRYYSRC